MLWKNVVEGRMTDNVGKRMRSFFCGPGGDLELGLLPIGVLGVAFWCEYPW